VNFLIVDDHFHLRKGMAQTLTSFYPGCAVYESSSLAGALEALKANESIDLVLLDLNVEDSRGLETLKSLKHWCEEQNCNPRVVVVSAGADYDETLVPRAIEHCATGFITKGCSEEVFQSAIQITLAGSIFIPQRYLNSKGPTRVIAAVAFTPRERQVADLLVQGLTYKQIARRLEAASPGGAMAENTVRVHVQRMAWKIRTTEGERADDIPAKAIVLTYLAGNQASGQPRTE
jgi:DNA-binding NarL/FixJ family response regulator